MIRGGTPAFVRNIIKNEDTVSLICAKFRTVSDAFSNPLPSSKISICKVEGQCKDLVVHLSDVLHKCVCLPVVSDKVSFIVMPFVHSSDDDLC
jgi:hypothetical protein